MARHSDRPLSDADLIQKLEKKFREINDLLYTTSVPNEDLEEKVLPYVAKDVIFRDPWQEGGNKTFYSIGMKGNDTLFVKGRHSAPVPYVVL